MQLPQKQKILSDFFFHLLNLASILNIFKKNMSLIADVFLNGIRKAWLDKCLRSPVSEDPLTSNTVNGPNTVEI